MASQGQDIGDEDAGVLQFPKGMTSFVGRFCLGCREGLSEPFINCAECSGSLCLLCFSKGYEGNGHRNYHSYKFTRDDFPLFDKRWTAKNEIELLDAVHKLGPSSWHEVSRQLEKFPSNACENHYMCNYIENPDSSLPRPESPTQLYRPLPTSFRTGLHDPPRPLPGSTYSRDMGGYCAARGDFSVEYFQKAELDVAAINELPNEEDEVEHEEITKAVVDVYNDKLRERSRRKRVVQEHGLIHVHKSAAARYRYEAMLGPKACSLILRFAQVVRGHELAKILEGLYAYNELKQRISNLQKYRLLGLTSKKAVEMYNQLKTRRDRSLQLQKQFVKSVQTELPVFTQETCVNQTRGQLPPQPSRRSAPPLEIIGLPGYDRLTDEEKQLCSVGRITPEAYLEFKDLLINECRNKQGIRLKQARTIIKIDVNKTRKIFDHLMEQKMIYPPSK